MYKNKSEEDRRHAMNYVEYQNKRGGRVVQQSIAKPDIERTWTAIEALKTSLELEKSFEKDLLELHSIAEKHKDAHLANFIEDGLLKEQISIVKEIATLLTKVEHAGDGLGLHVIDNEL